MGVVLKHLEKKAYYDMISCAAVINRFDFLNLQ